MGALKASSKTLCAAVGILGAASFPPGIVQAGSITEIGNGEQTHLPQLAQSASGYYVLDKGKRYQLCREFLENLRLLGEVPRRICELPFDKSLKNFRKVEWESLEPLEHMDIVKEVVINQFDHQYNSTKTRAENRAYWESQKDNVLALARSGSLALGRARFDLNHDGKVETVYRYGRLYRGKSLCDPDRYPRFGKYGWAYHVRPQDNPDVSNVVRYRLSSSPSDAFYYKGRIYLLKLGDYILEPQKSMALVNVCQFRWVQ